MTEKAENILSSHIIIKKLIHHQKNQYMLIELLKVALLDGTTTEAQKQEQDVHSTCKNHLCSVLKKIMPMDPSYLREIEKEKLHREI